MNDFIPRKTRLKNLKVTGYNVFVLCCGELFDIIHHDDDFIHCLRFVKNFVSKYYDDIVIVPTFEQADLPYHEQQ